MAASSATFRSPPAGRRSAGWLGLIASGLLLGSLVGCASWTGDKGASPAESSSLLPQRKLNPDSVVIETVLVRFPAEKAAEMERDVWQLSNEGIADIAIRRLLDQNGLRAGVIHGELPSAIRQQLAPASTEQASNALEQAGLAADVDNRRWLLQCRAGRPKELLVKSELSEPLTVISTRDGQHLSGETFQRAKIVFDLRAVPHGDGSATVSLIPQVQHGDHRQMFVHSDLGTRPEMRRGLQTWNELKVSAKLSAGQILVISSSSPPKALGSAFFVSKTVENTEDRVLLLLRLAESQLDELFAPEIVAQAQAMAER